LKLDFKYQLIFYFVIFAISIIFSINFIIYNISGHYHNKTVMSNIKSKFYEREKFLLSEIHRYTSFLDSIRNSKVFQEKIYMSDMQAISEILKARVSGERDIFRLRLIDTDGQEIVSIRKKNNQVTNFPLQDKSKRYYFQETRDLKDGDVWFSRIDLNRDFGKLEFPIRPTIRVIMPIFAYGKKEGIIIANISMKNILKQLSKTTLYDIALIDKYGEFIYFNNGLKDYSWSKYLDKNMTFYQEHPHDAKVVLSRESYISDHIFSKKISLDNGEEIRMILHLKEKILHDKKEQLREIIFISIIFTLFIGAIILYFLIVKINQLKETHEKEILDINQKLHDSINVASVIQNSILPDKAIFKKCFDDYFIYYEPKDIVSGDIYLIKEISEYEQLIILVDCTGHGVSGAFITMLVKAIEKDLINHIHQKSSVIDITDKISTSSILSIFNQTIKDTLKQHSNDSMTNSDFGLDGCAVYINRKHNFAKYSGANMPLYIIQNENIRMLKADKVSIGYKKTLMEQTFREYYIDLLNKPTIYMTTDGIIDQLGGHKGFPLGRKKFMSYIYQNHKKSFENQKMLIEEFIQEYQKDYENVDDRTVIALKF
jgi:serine phosphatase RsbU (regulator of sigma subunit)